MFEEKLLLLNPKSKISIKRYCTLIRYFRTITFDGYSENHHIIPKSMGGDDSKENLIRVSARVHFILHWLLWKSFKNREMSFAFHVMLFGDPNNTRYSRLNSKTYSALMQDCRKLNTGENHPLYGKPKSPEAIEKQRVKMLGRKWSDERKLQTSLKMKKDYEENPRPCVNLTEEIRKLISDRTKGISKTFSEEHKKNLYVHELNKIVLTCPHCNKTGQKPNMLRWHFDNCKLNQVHND